MPPVQSNRRGAAHSGLRRTLDDPVWSEAEPAQKAPVLKFLRKRVRIVGEGTKSMLDRSDFFGCEVLPHRRVAIPKVIMSAKTKRSKLEIIIMAVWCPEVNVLSIKFGVIANAERECRMRVAIPSGPPRSEFDLRIGDLFHAPHVNVLDVTAIYLAVAMSRQLMRTASFQFQTLSHTHSRFTQDIRSLTQSRAHHGIDTPIRSALLS
jgi:hypothetical protein